MNPYPRQKELLKITKWDYRDFEGLVDYVKDLWWQPEWGFHLTGKRILRLQLHTGGWSGNEDIIQALVAHPMFWSMCWRKSTVGGHYWFRIKILSKGGN